MKTLITIGNRYVLQHGEAKRSFKDAHDLCNHINRFNLKGEISGLNQLPDYFKGLIGYSEPRKPLLFGVQLSIAL